MATLNGVRRLALALPEATEGVRYGHATWFVRSKAFVWERPFSRADIKRFDPTQIPAGPIVAVRVDDLAEKEAILASQAGGFFTIPHFNGYAAVLVELQRVSRAALRDAIADAWLCVAPRTLVNAYLAEEGRHP